MVDVNIDDQKKDAPAIAPKPQPAFAPSSSALPPFVTLAKPVAAPAAKAKVELPPANIKFEVSQEVLAQIKPGTTVQANFFALGIKIGYRLQKDDTAATGLEKLRDAIWAAKLGQPLPPNSSAQSVNSYKEGVLAAHISTGISDDQGDCDCRIEVFE